MKPYQTILLLLVSLVVLHAQTAGNDSAVVKSIIAANSLQWNLQGRFTTNDEGRITTLNLDNIDFGKTGITQLPEQIGQLTALTALTINDNDLTSIPKEIFSLTQLKILEIQNNNLLSLPSGLGSLVHLSELDLRNNQLKELPAEIGQLQSLRKLHLWGNDFVTLPAEIGNLVSLKELYLKGNKLETLPASITKLRIVYLDILDNKLCGVSGPIDLWLKKFDAKYISLQKCQNEKRFQ